MLLYISLWVAPWAADKQVFLYICVRILLYICLWVAPRAADKQVFRYICVRILLYISLWVAPWAADKQVVSPYACVLILLCMCPHSWLLGLLTSSLSRHIHVSSYCYICVLIRLCMCPHTATYASSYGYVFVLTLLYMRPLTAICVPSYCYIPLSSVSSFPFFAQVMSHFFFEVSKVCMH